MMESLSTSSLSSTATSSTANERDESGTGTGGCKYYIRYNFAKITLSAGNNCGDDCGSNGLPITPNSISIIGNFQSKVDSVQHPNIVQYVDCYRSKNGKLIFMFVFLFNFFRLN